MLYLISTAAAMDDATLRAMMTSLRPDIERATGRPFGTLPAARIATRTQVKALIAACPWWYPPERWLAEAPTAPRLDGLSLDDASAVYIPDLDTLYVFDYTLTPEQASDPQVRKQVEDRMASSVAHELTHAMQARWSLSTFEQAHVSPVLLEGQARAVEGALFTRLWWGDIADVDPADTVAYTYAYGARFAQVYTERFGKDAWWWLLAHAAPTREEVLAVTRATAPGGWVGAAGLATAARSALPDAPQDTAQLRTSITPLIGQGERDSGQLTGMAAAAVWPQGSSVAAAFLFRDAEGAAQAMERRSVAATHVDTGVGILADLKSRLTLVVDDKPKVRRLPPRERPPDVDDTLTFRAENSDREIAYAEAWAQRGRVLYVSAWFGAPEVNPVAAVLAETVKIEVETAPRGIDASPEALAALTRLAPPPDAVPHLPEASGPPPGSLYRAAGLWRRLEAGDPQTCLEAARGEPAGQGDPFVLRAGVACAAAAGDKVALVELATRTEVDDLHVLEAASALARLGAVAESRRLLTTLSSSGATDPVYARVELDLAVATSDREAVDRAAADGRLLVLDRVSALTRAQAASPTTERTTTIRDLCDTSLVSLQVCGRW